jgi:presenilin-like A22 family membrane protease
MDNDKVLRDFFKSSNQDKLPYGFENMLMVKIFRKAEQQKRRSYFLGIGLISLVSITMVSSTIYVLKRFFDVKITFPKLEIPNFDTNIVGFFVFIAAITLFLLIIDTYIRMKKNIKRNNI